MHLERVDPDHIPSLSDDDARIDDKAPDREKLKENFAELHDRLEKLQRVFYADGRYSLLIVLQGRDASGKDGTIRKVFGAFNPQGCRVTSFGVPTDLELAHDFLWRIHKAVPPRSMIGVFNRSHYEDVLAVRVHDLVPEAVWSDRYRQINAFEDSLAANGVIIRKFFLHISSTEQKQRLQKRLTNPNKNWKFRAGDLDDRARWDDYTDAYRDLLNRCSTERSPWFVVPADDKKVRDYLVARELVDTLESLDLRYPEPAPDIMRYATLVD